MPYNPHVIDVTNNPSTAGPYFDLDFVQIARQIGQEKYPSRSANLPKPKLPYFSDTVYLSTLDDTSPFVHYDEGWEPSAAMQTLNHNGTIHQTTTVGSTLSIMFQGSSIVGILLFLCHTAFFMRFNIRSSMDYTQMPRTQSPWTTNRQYLCIAWTLIWMGTCGTHRLSCIWWTGFRRTQTTV